MFRRELSILGIIVIAIFVSVAASSWYAAHLLHKNATMLVLDTLPGLVDAGGAINQMHENWLRINLVLQQPGGVRSKAVEQIRTNSTEGLWKDYGRSLFSEEDRRRYQTLTEARNAFIGRRDRFFELATSGSDTEARELLEQELRTLYSRYETAAGDLFAYNANVGQSRGALVINYARFAPFAISAMATFLFLLGVVFGWRFAWSGPELLSRFQKK